MGTVTRIVPLVATVATAALAGWIGYRLADDAEDAFDPREALLDPAVREAVLEALVEESGGIFDLHVDADVGRVMQRNLDGHSHRETEVSTNPFGMREETYAIPKPDGLTRVVLLGDSYVFGSGVEAHERFGVHLARTLAARSGVDPSEVECLHLGVSSWNLLIECAYLRRQLEFLEPDLVVHVTVGNDLNDCVGVRGVGVPGSVVPRHRERGNAILRTTFPINTYQVREFNHLNTGLDWESRQRFDEARAAVLDLAAAVEAQGGRYQLLVNWGSRNPVFHEHVARHLREDQRLWLTPEAFSDGSMILGPGDSHWSPKGHRRIARLVFGAITARGLLPALTLEPWDKADVEMAALHERGTPVAGDLERLLESVLTDPPLRASLDLAAMGPADSRQAYGGVDSDGKLGAYAAFVLSAAGARTLRVSGSFLERPVLAGTPVRVFVEEQQVGTIEVRASGDFDESFALSDAIGDRDFVSVRFESDDYVYVDLRSYSCRVLKLAQIALE